MSAQGICDESSGLDPLMQVAFVELLREEPGRGKTVFLSSHQVTEVERIAHRVAIISDGSKDGLMTHLCVAKLIHITLHSGRSACRSRWDQRSCTQKMTLPHRTVRLDHGKTSLRPLFCEWPQQRKACR